MTDADAVAAMDAWLDTMRASAGYCGPVAHWWRSSLFYAGPSYDWRYEGIIAGYLNLARNTGDDRWLAKARRAGDDLVQAQGRDGRYRISSFEANPSPGGTPHEAAADIGLLLLAKHLRLYGLPGWEIYVQTAQLNVDAYLVRRLWHEDDGFFWDDPGKRTFVPNKTATIVEALLLLAELSERLEYIERYVHKPLGAVLKLQTHAPGVLDGGIAQAVLGTSTVEAYYPYYNARCVSALVAAHKLFGTQHYLDSAIAAMQFIDRCQEADGGFPQVLYPGDLVNRYPRWVAGTGDILRVAKLLEPYGYTFPVGPTYDWLTSGVLPSGGWRTAEGFASQVTQQQPSGVPDFRDLLPCVGWVDKAFRYLTEDVAVIPEPASSPTRTGCTINGDAAVYSETLDAIEVERGGRSIYRWRKGSAWAQVSPDAVLV